MKQKEVKKKTIYRIDIGQKGKSNVVFYVHL